MNSARYQDTSLTTQKSVVFLCTNNEISERKSKKTIPFKISL